jgi:hypothetical protein
MRRARTGFQRRATRFRRRIPRGDGNEYDHVHRGEGFGAQIAATIVADNPMRARARG